MARILFVDDDMITLQILGKATEMLGHQPILLEGARYAIDRVNEINPDMIMIDMMMPDMDGLDALTRFRAQLKSRATPIIILSAGVARDDSKRVLAAGAQAYLNKPISLNTLSDTIQRYTHT